ncbi:PAS domain S-box protein [Verrucomicrobiota bacterium sgz303538]
MKESTRRPASQRYAVAVGAVVAIAAIDWFIQPIVRGYAPMSIFSLAVMAAAWWGGLEAGLLALALSVVAANLLFMGQVGSFTVPLSFQWVHIISFLAVNVAVCFMMEGLHRARRSADARAREIREKHDALERAMIARERAEAQLGHIVESVHDFAIVAMDCDGRIIRWNAGSVAIFGYSEEEVRGESVELIFTPEDRTAGVPQHELKNAREKGWAEDERWHLRKDGTRFFGSGSVSPVRDGAGTLVGFTKVLRDATKRWKALRALRESEESFRAVFETVAVGMVQVEPQTGNFLRVNRCFCGITGYREEELIGKSFRELTHPDDSEADYEVFQRMVRGESKEYVAEKRYVRKDGRVIWVHVSGTPVCDGVRYPPLYIVGVVQDITERRYAELAQAEAEERFRLASEIAGLGAWDTNYETEEIHWSPRLKEIFGLPADAQIGGETALQMIHPEDRPELSRRIEEAMAPDGPGTYFSEHRVVRPDGTVRWVQIRGLFLFTGEGQARRVVRGIGAVLDITERKREEERMQKREEALLSLATTQSSKLEERIRQVTEAAASALDVERVGVWLYTADREAIQCEDLYMRSKRAHGNGTRLAASEFPRYFEALARGAPILADNARTHPATAEFRASYLELLGITSMLDVPIWVGGRLAGVLCHEHTGSVRRWSADEQEFAASLAMTVALALEAEERRRAEAALAARERQLRQIGDSLPEGILYQVLVFPDGHSQFLYFSAGLERQTGLTPEEALRDADALWGIVSPEAVQKLLEAQAEAIQKMVPVDMVVPLRHKKTHEFRWMHVRSRPEQTSQGAVLFNGLAIDVTTQRQIEAALEEAEERLRLAAKAGGIGTFDTNLETGESHWSPEMDVIFDLSPGTAVPLERIPSLIHPDDRERVFGEIERARDPAGSGSFESVLRVLPPDGTVRWVRLNGRTDFVGEGANRRAVRTLGAALDITALKQAEEAARESSERFRTLADNMSQLAWMANETGWIFWHNRRWLEYTGTTPEEMEGWNWQKIVHPDYVERVTEKIRHHMEMREGWEYTFPLRDRDGNYRWFLTRAVPIRDAEGQVTRWFGTNTDVTEQRKGEEELREADRHKSEFLAMLGHELRNPLAAIRNVLSLCEVENESFEWAKGVVDRQSLQLARLVEDLLDVSRITRGKVTLRRERVDVCEAIGNAVEAARPLVTERRHVLSVACPPHSLWVEADPARLEQIVGNLLTNAAKYTEPGGRIWVTVSSAELPSASSRPAAGAVKQVSGDGEEEPAREITISIRDTGVGIPPEKLPQMFEIFTQAERSLDRSEGGLGLGLAIVKMLTEMHGGRVSAWSAGLGKGSTFSIHLPATPAPAVTAQPEPGAPERGAAVSVAAPPQHPSCKDQRVLVVDDNADAAEALGRLLRRTGCKLEIALDGPTALDRAHKFHPTAILLDIGLPGMDGYEVARRLRAEEHEEHALLVAITGYGQEEDLRRSREAGFDRHLVKPVDFGEIQRLLETGQSADSVQ